MIKVFRVPCVWAFFMAGTVATAAGNGAPLSARQMEGRQLFEATCIHCHDPSGWGTRDLARRLGADRSRLMERTDLDADYIRAVVRKGINSMPWYTRTDLSDRQIEAISDYLRRNNVKRD
jgi:mono/diheme cytochrome c family protein